MLIKQINDALRKNANNVMGKQGLTLTQNGVLVYLSEQDRQMAAMKEIEKFLGVAQPTVVGIVKRLEQKHYVESLEDEEDHRVKLVHLTRAGNEKCLEGQKHMEEAEKALLAPLDRDERQMFLGMLKKVRDGLQ
ncbi:MAG: MarR family winged helix-turn-helix transcriptional regulator [Eubacterium sp.]